MRPLLLTLLLVIFQISASSQDAQSLSNRDFSLGLSYGIGGGGATPGFLIQINGAFSLKKNFSFVSGLGGFHSVPSLSKEPNGNKNTFGSLFIYQGIAHTTWFDNNKKFVRIGADLLLTNFTSSFFERSFTTFDGAGNPITTEIIKFENSTQLGYHITVNGGSRISDKSSIGLSLDIFSYEIFGDIIVAGLKFSYQL